VDLGKRRLRCGAGTWYRSVILSSPRSAGLTEPLGWRRRELPVLDSIHAPAKVGNGALNVVFVEWQIDHGLPSIDRLPDGGRVAPS